MTSSNPITSRGLKGLLAAAFAGVVSVAMLVVALLHTDQPLIMFLAYFAAMPLYLAGLGAGALAGIVASVVGTLALFLTQPPNFGVLYMIAYGIPAIVLTGMALRYRTGADGKFNWYPEGKLLTAITLYPCILFLVAAAAASNHEGGLLDITQQAFKQVGTDMAAKFDENQVAVFQSALHTAAKIAPALVGYTWIVIAILSLAGAQNILERQKLNLRESFSLKSLYVPTWLIYSIAFCGLFALFAQAPYDYIGRNLALILGLPFFFVGLAVIHAWTGSIKRGIVLLVLFYALLLFMPWLSLIIAAVGVIDQWADFRQRIARKKTV